MKSTSKPHSRESISSGFSSIRSSSTFRFRKAAAPVLVLLISAIIGGALIATAPEAKRQASAPVIPTVEVVSLTARNYPVIIQTRGTVSPRTQSTLVPEVAGRITSVSANFRPGGFFEAGDTLLTIDPRDYENNVTMMRADLAQARLALEEETARVEQAQADWKRLGTSGKPSDLVLRKPQLASCRAAVAAATAKLRQAELELARTRITAPYAGRILEKSADVGQYATMGAVLASIYAVDYVEIRLPLTDEQASFVDLPEIYRDTISSHTQSTRDAAGGDPAILPSMPVVTISAEMGRKTHRWMGRIVRTEGSVDIPSRQSFVVAQVDDPYARHGDRPPLKVGTFVKAEIRGRVLQGVFVVPLVAVRSGNEVWLIDDEKRLEKRRVKAIWQDVEHVVVDQGLSEGESLVVTPLPYGVSGTRVNLLGEERTPKQEEPGGQ